MSEAFIVDAIRTPTGGRRGGLAHVHPGDLGGHVLRHIVERNGIPAEDYDDVVFGAIDTVGPLSFNIARTCWLAAGLPLTVPGVTIDRMCGSSQQAIHFAAQAVMSGTQDVVVVAGGVQTMSQIPIGYAFVAAEPLGLGDPFSTSEGWVARPHPRHERDGRRSHHDADRADPATKRALQRTGMIIADLDVVECNEAFASVPMAFMAETGVPHARPNPNGGGISLGHPIGATGARIMTTMLHELERTGGRYGLQTMCGGGGTANVTIIERLG
jgi:acetyl-CoA acetyltransferase